MKLIERYVDEVGSYLPERLQDDVGKELRSNLEEALEARLASGDWDSADQAEMDLLREFGPPHQLAESYLPGPRILFGPRLYPAFIKTMKISLGILIGIVALGLVVDFTRMSSAVEFWVSVGDSIQNLLLGGIFLLGAVAGIFAVIERTSVEPSTTKESWNPASLAEEKEPDKISLAEVVVGLVFLILALVVLNLFPEWVAIWVNLDEHSGTVPLLSDSFWSQLWLLNICLGLHLGLNLLLLRQGRWSTPLLWIRVVISLLFVVWLSRLIYGPPLFELDTDLLISQDWPASAIDHLQRVVQGRLLPLLSILVRIFFVAAIVGFCIQIFNTTRRTLSRV
ncbi:MAG: hypothetical protein P8Y44_12290 [Acidobacteriota bacterium]